MYIYSAAIEAGGVSGLPSILTGRIIPKGHKRKKKNEKKKHLSAYDPKNYKKHGKEVNGGGDLLEPAPPCTELKITNHTGICRQHQISRVQT